MRSRFDILQDFEAAYSARCYRQLGNIKNVTFKGLGARETLKLSKGRMRDSEASFRFPAIAQ